MVILFYMDIYNIRMEIREDTGFFVVTGGKRKVADIPIVIYRLTFYRTKVLQQMNSGYSYYCL